MRRTRPKRTLPDLQLQMTSMIDIVFLLLVFFVMTFKVVIPEGDFAIHMPPGGPGQSSLEQPPEKIQVRLRSGEEGSLVGIEAEGQSLASLAELRQLVLSLAPPNSGTQPAPGAEIEFDADPGLDYGHFMAAITAVKGYRGPRGEVIELIERIRILPQAAQKM